MFKDNMKHFALIIFFFIFAGLSFGQKKQCFCSKAPEMNGAAVSCETTKLKNNSKLYWQYNCKKIWLTLENNKGKKTIIDEVDPELFSETYRLGYHLIREFKNALLFRSGCPANGTCGYTLINKDNGKKTKEFDQLIEIDTDIARENPHPYKFDFVIYLAERDTVEIYYVDSKKTLTIPFSGAKDITAAPVPAYQFEKMTLRNNMLTLYYKTDDGKNKTLKINLSSKKYAR